MDDGDGKMSAGRLSGRGLNEESIAAKKAKLFGGGLADSKDGSDNREQERSSQMAQRAMTAPKQNIQNQNMMDGNASMGSQGSGIEVLDLPNSRPKRMIRPPTGGSGSN
jgi:hypothetical protein